MVQRVIHVQQTRGSSTCQMCVRLGLPWATLGYEAASATMMRLWAKREEQIRGVVELTAGLYGDLQGIAGRSLLEIDGLELPLLDGPTTADAAE
jgi:hypothetical protein